MLDPYIRTFLKHDGTVRPMSLTLSTMPFVTSSCQPNMLGASPITCMLTVGRQLQGRYFARFKAPDVYGVFKFVVDYKRPGLTPIELSHQISVRHFRHNEFERFIPAAFPYYASAFSCMAAFVIFSFVFLYHREKSD